MRVIQAMKCSDTTFIVERKCLNETLVYVQKGFHEARRKGKLFSAERADLQFWHNPDLLSRHKHIVLKPKLMTQVFHPYAFMENNNMYSIYIICIFCP